MIDMTVTQDPDSLRQREQREEQALAWARTGIISAFILFLVRPGLGHIGLAVFLIGLARLPSLGARLRAVLSEPMPRAALVLLAVLALAMTWSSAPWTERLAEFWHWRVLLLMILCLAVFDSRAWKLRLIFAATAAALLASAVGWITWALDFHLYKVHPAGTVLREGVAQGLFFGVCAYLSVICAWRVEGLSRHLRVALLAAAAVLVAALFFVSAGRSAQIALLVVALTTALAMLRGRARLLVVLALPAAFVIGILAAPMAKERFARGWNEFRTEAALDHPTSVGVRAELWLITAGLIADKPWFGYGTGAFPREYAKRAAATRTGWRAEPKDDTHNQYLSVQVQAGILGTVALAGFLLSAWRQPAPMPFRICALALLAGWGTVGLFFSVFEDFNEGHMIAILLGCLLAPEHDRVAKAPGSAASTATEAPRPSSPNGSG